MSVYAACAALAPSLPLAAAPLFPSLNIDPLGGPADPARPVATRSSRKALSPAIRRTSTRSPRSPRSAHGYAEAQYWGLPSHEALNLWRSLNPTYANAYGRFPIRTTSAK